ncbi:MAG: hypothetical protein QME35_01370 [Thermoanaerobacteraceae bacterium]|nr:hypothetical protein [Thermoanaerobacteraceae bacterium]
MDNLEKFLYAINNLLKIRVSFYSKDDAKIITRVCAPMDYGPSRRAKIKNDRFHLWDFESDEKNHVLSLNPDQVKSIEVLEDKFNLEDFITWDLNSSPWFYKRDWGKFS